MTSPTIWWSRAVDELHWPSGEAAVEYVTKVEGSFAVFAGDGPKPVAMLLDWRLWLQIRQQLPNDMLRRIG